MRRRACGLAVALAITLTATGCFGPDSPSPSAEIATPPRPDPAVVLPPPQNHDTYAVGARILHLTRGRDRPLPTLVFYPVGRPQQSRTTGVGDDVRAAAQKRIKVAQGNLRWKARPPAEGRFPLVLFCHGLSGSPERYADALAAWAAAGFVVAAPTFPHTSEFTGDFRRPDIVNQPADARYVLARLRALDRAPADPLWRRIDTDNVALIGHSAGGYTATGLLTAGHDPRLRAAVIMAGWAAQGAFAGPPATMLFLQGTADPIVRVAASRRLFARVPWPKSYLLMQHNSHATYLRPGDNGYDLMRSTVIDFLRWTLDGDESARRGLPSVVYPAAEVHLTTN